MGKQFYNQQGFIALTSVILISAVLLVLIVVISTSSFFARFNILDYENKKISSSLAEGCIKTALVNLAQDSVNYPGTIPNPAGALVTIETGKTCRICSVTTSNPYTIKTRAVYNNAYTNLTLVGNLGAANFSVTSWDETNSYPAGCNLP